MVTGSRRGQVRGLTLVEMPQRSPVVVTGSSSKLIGVTPSLRVPQRSPVVVTGSRFSETLWGKWIKGLNGARSW